MATETRRKGRFRSRPLTYVTPLYKSDLGLLSTYPFTESPEMEIYLVIV